MSDSVVYFDKKGVKYNLQCLKEEGLKNHPIYYIYAKKDGTKDDIMAACEFVVHKPYKDSVRDKNVCIIDSLDVEREYVGHGFGSALIKAVENVALSLGADSVTAKLAEKTGPIADLYIKNGYGLSGYLAIKDGLKHNDDIIDEPIKEVVALTDDALSSL